MYGFSAAHIFRIKDSISRFSDFFLEFVEQADAKIPLARISPIFSSRIFVGNIIANQFTHACLLLLRTLYLCLNICLELHLYEHFAAIIISDSLRTLEFLDASFVTVKLRFERIIEVMVYIGRDLRYAILQTFLDIANLFTKTGSHIIDLFAEIGFHIIESFFHHSRESVETVFRFCDCPFHLRSFPRHIAFRTAP